VGIFMSVEERSGLKLNLVTLHSGKLNLVVPSTIHDLNVARAISENPGFLSVLTLEERREVYERMGNDRIGQIRRAYGDPVAAFVIHPRSVFVNSHGDVESDISRHFPDWSPAVFGVSVENIRSADGRKRILAMYREFMNKVPSGFVVGSFDGLKTSDGRLVSSVLVAANMLPEVAFNAFGDELQEYGRAELYRDGTRRLLDAAVFARDVLGVGIIGLGGMTASMTRMGEDVAKVLPDMDPNGIVTGHEQTAVLMSRLVIETFRKLEINMAQSSVGVIGAGSIGVASATMLDGTVGRIIIQDKNIERARNARNAIVERRSGRVLEIATEILIVNADLDGTLWDTTPDDVVDGIENLEHLRNVDVLLTATTSTVPFVKGRFFKQGVVFIDDSQPPNVVSSEAERVNRGLLVRVVGFDGGVRRSFDYGLAQGSEFGCAIQTNATALRFIETGELMGGIGRVTYERAMRVKEMTGRYGFGQPVFERDGKLTSDSEWDRVRQVRRDSGR
jgi:predicted amino acid dehydrogenase